MAMSNAERQKRYRERRDRNAPVRKYIIPVEAKGRPPSRPQRWRAAVEKLVELQDEYRAWYDRMPHSLQSTETGLRLELLVGLDLAELREVELPRGFGRDG